MFKRGRRPWRRGQQWPRNEEGVEAQQFQSDEMNNASFSPHEDFSGDNFAAGRGGKKRDFQPQNGPVMAQGTPHFGKKQKNTFNSNDFSEDPNNHFANHPHQNMQQNMHQNHQQHNMHQNVRPNHPQQIMRPNHPPHNMRPNHPPQNMRPMMRSNHPPQNMRPNHPQQNMHPHHPPQNMRPMMRPNHPQQLMRPNNPPQNIRPNHPQPNVPPNHSQHMHDSPQMHPPHFEDEPRPEENGDEFPPRQMSMDSVAFRCTLCGKPFKKQVLLDMHLNTECTGVMSQGPSQFPSDNFHRGNHFRGRRAGARRRGRGRRGAFNHNFNPPVDEDGNIINTESSEGWSKYENENFSNNEFPQQHFRGNRGRDRGRGRGFYRPPYRGGPMGPQQFQNNNFDDGSYPPDEYDENSNSYDGPSDEQFNMPNHNPPQTHHPQRSQRFPFALSCNLCTVQCNTFDELEFHKDKFHLKCKFCVAYFATKPDLYMHQETHLTGENSSSSMDQNSSEPFNGGVDMEAGAISTTCEMCSATFPHHDSLSTHLQNDHGQLPLPPMFPLPEDVEGFNGPSETVAVEVIPEQVISFPCCLCVSNYSCIDELAEHISATHPPAIVCRDCGHVFKEEEQLEGHHKYEHGMNSFPEKERQAILAHTDYYPCEMCSEIQCNPPALETHMHFHRVHNLVHETKIRTVYVPCPDCNVMIKSNALKNHILNNHKTISCNVCQQVFNDKYVFVKHVDLEHYPNCVCNICCAICFNNNALQQHGATEHAMGEMFKCNLCAKRFGLRTLLSIHQLCHSELFSQCKVCGEFFKIPELMLEFRSHMVETHGMDSSMFV